MSTNPYAPPRTELEAIAAMAELPALSERLAHLEAEDVVATFGEALRAGGVMLMTILVAGTALVLLTMETEGWRLVDVVVLAGILAVASLPFLLGTGLVRFQPWARKTTLLLVIPATLLVPLWAWLGWVLWTTLRSQAGRRLFTEAHAEVRAQTPGVHARKRADIHFITFAGPVANLIAWTGATLTL